MPRIVKTQFLHSKDLKSCRQDRILKSKNLHNQVRTKNRVLKRVRKDLSYSITSCLIPSDFVL